MKKKLRGIFALIMILCLVLSGCGSDGGADDADGTTAAADSGQDEGGEGGDTVKIGMIAASTGVNQSVGQFSQEGAQFAVDEINAAGGILGHQVELVVEDEVDNLQASVNAATKLLERDDIVAIIGSPYSQNTLAIMDQITEAKIPFVTGGSGDAIAEAGNEYIWQPRNLDSVAAGAIAQYAYEELGIENPAILYCTQPTTQAGGFDIQEAYATEYGIEIPDSMMFGYTEDEKNFAPIVAQVMASGADGILSFSNENPHSLLSIAIADAGCTLPRVGSSTVTSSVVLENAGNAVNGWIAVADWSANLDTEAASAFQAGYSEKYGHDTERASAVSYDAVYMIKMACEAADSVTDLAAINEGFKSIENYDAAIGTMTYHEDHGFLNSAFIVECQDGKWMLLDSVQYRD